MNAETTIDAEEVADEIPTQWDVENDGPRTVNGGARGYDTDEDGIAGVPASFSITHTGGEVFQASWSTPSVRGYHSVESRVEGVKERCIEFIAGKADDLHIEQGLGQEMGQ